MLVMAWFSVLIHESAHDIAKTKLTGTKGMIYSTILFLFLPDRIERWEYMRAGRILADETIDR